MKPFYALALLMVLWAVSASADIYSWTDKNGVKHYSNDPPPPGEKVTGLIVMKETPEPQPADTSSAKSSSPSEPKTEMPQKSSREVVLYVDPRSASSKQAKAWFEQNKIPCVLHDITSSEEEKKRFEALHGTGTPLIFIGDQRVDGWDEKKVKELLDVK